MPLPPGLALDPATGLITGVPTVPWTYNYALIVRDAQGSVRQIPVSHVINPYDPPAIAANPGQYATRTVPYSAQFNVTGGSGPFTWSVASGVLPVGLVLDPDSGLLAGTPTDTTYTNRPLTIRVVDALGSAAQFPYTLRYRNALSTAHVYPVAVQGTPYSSTPAMVGGHTPLAFAMTSGTLPAGLSFNTSTGAITGTPTAISSSAINVQVTDAAGNTTAISQTFQSVEAYTPIAITGTMTNTARTYQRATGTEVINPTNTLGTTGGTGSINWSWARISGSTKIAAASPSSRTTGFNCTAAPGENVSAVFRVTAADGISSDVYDVTISGNNTYVFPALSGSPPVRATFGKAYTGSFTLTGGKAPVSYALVGGVLPTGLTLNTGTGVISGTPTDTNYTDRAITVRVTDAESQTANRSYTLQYRAALALSGTPGPAYTTQPYSFTPTIAGGHASYNFVLLSGTLPAGTSLNAATGEVSGTTTTAATYNYTLRCTDADGNVADRAYSTTVNAYAVPSLSGALQDYAVRGTAYTSALTRSNGLAPFTWAVVSGTLPTGISINAGNGSVNGTPTATSYTTHLPVIRVTDALGNSATSDPQDIDYRNRPTMTGRALARRTRTQAINESVASASSPLFTPVTYAITAGSLPTGASLNTSTGAITGTLTSTTYGDYSVTIRATDAVGTQESATYTLAYANVLGISVADTTPEGEVGTAWSTPATASGGFTPYTFAIASGALPAGVTLNTASGAISGTPTGAGGSGSYTVRVTDAAGNQATTAAINWTVYAQLTRTAQWPGGTIYRNVSIGTVQGITVTGGKTPRVFAVASGALPAGISLNTGTGQLTGTPTGTGAYSFTLRCTDNLGVQVTTTTISGTVVQPVALTDKLIVSNPLSGTAVAAIVLSNNGTAYERKNGIDFPVSGEWLASGAAADFEARWTTASGTLNGGTAGVWQNLGTTRTWSKTQTAPGLSQCTGTLEIRLAATGQVLATATIELEAVVE